MRAVIQRVSEANVIVDNQIVGSIKKGFLVLLGIKDTDKDSDAKFLATKISKMRVFEDDAGKMNLALKDIEGSVLAVSQFTLFADTKKGNRPSFLEAARPEIANPLYEEFCRQLEIHSIHVEKGVFGAHMDVSLTNDGPVTITIDTEN